MILERLIKTLSNRFPNIVASVDQTGNAVAGGNRDTTISGRCFYNYMKHKSVFWICFMYFINFSFYGLDGSGHCEQAYNNDKGEVYHDACLFDKVLLLIFSIPVCILVTIIGYTYMLYKLIKRK